MMVRMIVPFPFVMLLSCYDYHEINLEIGVYLEYSIYTMGVRRGHEIYLVY